VGRRAGAVEAVVRVDRTFWAGRRVLVTGHTGFKGGWLSLWLNHMGADVTGYALAPPSNPSLFECARVAQGMQSVIGDVRDLAALRDAMQAARPQVVLHLAAQSLVRRSYRDPVETYATNVMGTVNVLEAVRACTDVKAVVVVTSDKCYENREWVWGYRENEAMGGHDPYSSSKGCAELVAAAWRRSFLAEAGTGVATARAGNVIGGGDWAEDRLIPDILGAFGSGTPVAIRSPQATRPWQHVLEPLAGYLMLAEKLVRDPAGYAEAWNFGPQEDDVQPVSWIVERMAVRWGAGAAWRADDAPHPHEAGCLKLDSAKARARLDWQPRLRLEQALDWIVDWHKALRGGDDMRAFTLAQIARFSGNMQQ